MKVNKTKVSKFYNTKIIILYLIGIPILRTLLETLENIYSDKFNGMANWYKSYYPLVLWQDMISIIIIFIYSTIFLYYLSKAIGGKGNLKIIEFNVLLLLAVYITPPIFDFFIFDLFIHKFNIMNYNQLVRGVWSPIGLIFEAILVSWISYHIVRKYHKLNWVKSLLIISPLIISFPVNVILVPKVIRKILDYYTINTEFNFMLLWNLLLILYIPLGFYIIRKFQKRESKYHKYFKLIKPYPIIYFIIVVLYSFSLVKGKFDIVNIFRIILTSLSAFFSWNVAGAINDYYDKDIDKISNKNRPYVSGLINDEELRIFIYLNLALGIIASLLVSINLLIIFAVTIIAGYVYSSPPFRIKSRTMFSTAIIGIGTFLTLLAGLFIKQQDLLLVSTKIILNFLLISFSVSLISLVKDLKDIKGDKKAMIPTIPVIYGTKKGSNLLKIFLVIGYLMLIIAVSMFALNYKFLLIIILLCTINIYLIELFKKSPNKTQAEIIYKYSIISFMVILVLGIYLQY